MHDAASKTVGRRKMYAWARYALALTSTLLVCRTASGQGVESWADMVPRVPVGDYVEYGVDALSEKFGFAFEAVATGIDAIYGAFETALLSLPAPLVGGALVVAIWRLTGRSAGILALLGVLLINSVELWPQTMSTFALMTTAVFIALIIGIPIGIAVARNDALEAAVTPLLDFMQTLPPFVYLIPAVVLFGIGPVPAILATVFYAVAVPIRLTNVGIRQVDREVVEAGEAFGLTTRQILVKIKLPLALPVIIAGINQTIMYSLAMVIVASMIGAGGLGAEILRGITRLQLGIGFEAGLAVVMVAILLDRLGRGVASSLGGGQVSKRKEVR